MKALIFLLLASSLSLAAADANVTGKWSGPTVLTRPDGTKEDGSAFAILKQDGARVTGTAGPDETTQWPITKGAIDGDKVTLEVQDADGVTIYKLSLVLDGDRLKGPFTFNAADGQTVSATVDFTRVK
jgi:hypothetical protein